MDCIIRKVTDTELHPSNVKMGDGFCLIKSWKPLVPSLKEASLTGYSKISSRFLHFAMKVLVHCPYQGNNPAVSGHPSILRLFFHPSSAALLFLFSGTCLQHIWLLYSHICTGPWKEKTQSLFFSPLLVHLGSLIEPVGVDGLASRVLSTSAYI
jgi:hypothetical protein